MRLLQTKCLPLAKRRAKGYHENDKTVVMASLGFLNEDVMAVILCNCFHILETTPPTTCTYLHMCHLLEYISSPWHLFRLEKFLRVQVPLGCIKTAKCGHQPFSCPGSKNVTHCRKENCSTCLSKEFIPAIHFGNSKHPLPTRSFRFLRGALRSTSSAVWLHHAHPSLQLQEKTSLMQRSRVLTNEQ